MQYHIQEIYAVSEDRYIQPSNLKDRWILTRMYTMLALGSLLADCSSSRPFMGRASSFEPPGMEYFAIASALLPGISDFLSLDAVQALALIASRFEKRECAEN